MWQERAPAPGHVPVVPAAACASAVKHLTNVLCVLDWAVPHPCPVPSLLWLLVSENDGCVLHEEGLPSLLVVFPLLCSPGQAGTAYVLSLWTST